MCTLELYSYCPVQWRTIEYAVCKYPLYNNKHTEAYDALRLPESANCRLLVNWITTICITSIARHCLQVCNCSITALCSYIGITLCYVLGTSFTCLCDTEPHGVLKSLMKLCSPRPVLEQKLIPVGTGLILPRQRECSRKIVGWLRHLPTLVSDTGTWNDQTRRNPDYKCNVKNNAQFWNKN